MASNDSNADIKNSESSSSLEHALLESLFYNEMMMMDDSSSCISSDFMAYLGSNSEIPPCAPDAGAIAEKDMLRDFGVASSGAPRDPTATATVQSSQPTQRHVLDPSTATPKHDEGSVHAATLSTDTSASPDKEAGQTNLLISQFAVLAGRLGISLPTDVLSSLTHQATTTENNNGEHSSYQQSLQALSQLIQAQAQKGSPVAPNEAASSDEAGNSADMADVTPAVHELQNVAEAAIATVTETRKRTQSEANNGTKAPLYSKRRKKPRLADCESKLASLKAENEMLKRHLDTISNRSKKFDQERKAQEQQMKRLMNEGAGPEKLNPLLSKFSEVYSDYGENRHQELTFHLQQLQRYVFLSLVKNRIRFQTALLTHAPDW